MNGGYFITFEGGEGVGKSTQIESARKLLVSRGHDVVMTREPGGTERAERIRELLLTPTDEPMPQICELLLVFAARSTHLSNVIRPALARGACVICDRFTDATYAYQGAGRNLPHATIKQLEQLVQQEVRPHLTLLLDAPLEVAMRRARDRNRDRGNAEGDRFEREQLEFFRRVRDGYLAIAQREPQRVKVIDASLDIVAVENRVRDEIVEFLEAVK
jgi:dTMP kinase